MQDNTDPVTLSTFKSILHSAFQFSAGGPVPDGVPYSEITLQNHPSNITVFEASCLKDAMDNVKHAIRHGKQGAVWLANQSEPPEQGNADQYFYDRIRELFAMKEAGYLKEVSDYPIRSQSRSGFFLHGDGRVVTEPENFCKPSRADTVRVIFNVEGLGSVLLNRNIVLASKLQGSSDGVYERILPEELGHAYLAPAGSVTFALSNYGGINKALLHSQPYVPKAQGTVRKLGVADIIFE